MQGRIRGKGRKRGRGREGEGEKARETSTLRDSGGCEKPKTSEGDTAGASQPKAVAEAREKRGEDVCFRRGEIRWNSGKKEEGGGGEREEDGAGFLVYRGINPYPQLPFVLGAAWSTC
jgi:hypothetical protein